MNTKNFKHRHAFTTNDSNNNIDGLTDDCIINDIRLDIERTRKFNKNFLKNYDEEIVKKNIFFY